MSIHERIPVILHSAECGCWLDRSLTDPTGVSALFQPYPADLLEMWPVSPLVNTQKHDRFPTLEEAVKLHFLIALVFAMCAGPASAKEPIRIIEGIVSKVSDGDTVQVQDALGTRVKVRLYGIDAPETEKMNRKTGRISKPGQPYGEEAFQALKGKIGGQRVSVEVRDIDRYRRAVSVVRLGVRDINQEMVREGFAWAYRQYLDRPYASDYIQAEELARREKRGLWRQGNPLPPWEFRKVLRKGQRERGVDINLCFQQNFSKQTHDSVHR